MASLLLLFLLGVKLLPFCAFENFLVGFADRDSFSAATSSALSLSSLVM